MSYGPYDKPEIAVAVIVESSDKGVYTAKVAADIYSYYFSSKEVEGKQTYNTFLP